MEKEGQVKPMFFKYALYRLGYVCNPRSLREQRRPVGGPMNWDLNSSGLRRDVECYRLIGKVCSVYSYTCIRKILETIVDHPCVPCRTMSQALG